MIHFFRTVLIALHIVSTPVTMSSTPQHNLETVSSVSPVEVSGIGIKKIPNNEVILDDLTEKQYINSLIKSKKNSFLKILIIPDVNTPEMIRDENILQKDISLQDSIPKQMAIIKGEGCQPDVLPYFAEYLNEHGEKSSSCPDYYNYIHKQQNDLLTKVIVDKIQIQSDKTSFKESYSREQLKIELTHFCSNDLIPYQYKNYCLSLF